MKAELSQAQAKAFESSQANEGLEERISDFKQTLASKEAEIAALGHKLTSLHACLESEREHSDSLREINRTTQQIRTDVEGIMSEKEALECQLKDYIMDTNRQMEETRILQESYESLQREKEHLRELSSQEKAKCKQQLCDLQRALHEAEQSVRWERERCEHLEHVLAQERQRQASKMPQAVAVQTEASPSKPKPTLQEHTTQTSPINRSVCDRPSSPIPFIADEGKEDVPSQDASMASPESAPPGLAEVAPMGDDDSNQRTTEAEAEAEAEACDDVSCDASRSAMVDAMVIDTQLKALRSRVRKGRKAHAVSVGGAFRLSHEEMRRRARALGLRTSPIFGKTRSRRSGPSDEA